MQRISTIHLAAIGGLLFASWIAPGYGAEWPQWGGSSARNNVSDAENLPTQWDVGQFDFKTGEWQADSAENILWVAKLGSESYSTPVIAGGKIFCASNNDTGYVPRYPKETDLGCLLCFRQSDGRFGWQLSREKLAAGRSVDWPSVGICCSPLIERERGWIVTNRGEVVCFDTDGFYDGVNDGPYREEPNSDREEADFVWCFDMMRSLGSMQHNMCSCSVTAIGDLLLVNTGNGVDDAHEGIPAPEAPSFIALNKHTGELIWADASPGGNLLHGQWGSPAAAVIDGIPQAIFAAGDGWMYSFLAEPTDDKKAKLLWKFDCNPKESRWKEGGQGDRNSIIATPVVYQNRVYLATGQDPEYGEGPGHLWCIDPTKRGDLSQELVVDKDGNPVAVRRIQACDKEAGEVVKPNPNSAVVWHYTNHDANGDGKFDFEEEMHRTLGMVAIKDDLLVIADLAGLFHCLDAKTGKVHWTYDMLASMWGSPLIADGKIFIGDEDGEVAVFELSKQQNLLSENNVGGSVYSAPVAVDGVLYISTRSHLIAIQAK